MLLLGVIVSDKRNELTRDEDRMSARYKNLNEFPTNRRYLLKKNSREIDPWYCRRQKDFIKIRDPFLESSEWRTETYLFAFKEFHLQETIYHYRELPAREENRSRIGQRISRWKFITRRFRIRTRDQMPEYWQYLCARG